MRAGKAALRRLSMPPLLQSALVSPEQPIAGVKGPAEAGAGALGPDLCCCDISIAQNLTQMTGKKLSALGVDVPASLRSGKALPAYLHAPPAICKEELRSSCVDAMRCLDAYGETASALAADIARSQGAEEEVAQAIAASGELVVQVILLGENTRAQRKKNAEKPVVPAPPQGGLGRFLTCDSASFRPAFAGWCHDGSFYGLAQVGALGGFAESDRNVRAGAQVALVSQTQKNFSGGAQIGVFHARTGGNFRGVAQLGAYNAVWHDFNGLVQAGLVNSAGRFNGLVQAGLINSAGRTSSVQAGLYSDAWVSRGVQVGGLFARGHSAYGLSVSPVTLHQVHNGLDIGALVRIAETTRGLGIGGVVSSSGDLSGASIGLVNVGAKVRGAQIGLVNVASSLAGAQIGLVNIVRGRRFGVLPLLNAGAG